MLYYPTRPLFLIGCLCFSFCALIMHMEINKSIRNIKCYLYWVFWPSFVYMFAYLLT